MSIPESLKAALQPVSLICGHYGVGKTNFALNLALDLARNAYDVRLADLDIVNPYFRSSEYCALLEEAGVDLVAPVMANSSLDTPSLSAAVDGAIEWARVEPHRILIMDIGGDDAGATALGRYSERIAAADYALLYVVNAYRNLTQDPQEAIAVLHEIEAVSRLHATAVVNNSHLRRETTAETVQNSRAFGEEVAAHLGIPLVAQTVPNWYSGGNETLTQKKVQYPNSIQVRMPWE